MITLVLTNRNRDLRIIKNCLQSLYKQTRTDFECFLVDYGSEEEYKTQLEKLLKNYPNIRYIDCPVQGQLWNKSRAINLALKETNNPYFLVGDIDLIFRPDFFEIIQSLNSVNQVIYFQVGFLNEMESIKEKSFEDYSCHHFSSIEATGITLFPTHFLKTLHGYDEFYHGWGAEDTDIHIRMKNAGYTVNFYNQSILLKHQWHPKVYRSKQSTHPFHSQLERVNHAYMLQTERSKRTVVNQNQDWGTLALSKNYEKLNTIDTVLKLKATMLEVHAGLAQMANFKKEVVLFEIQAVSGIEKIKNRIKKIIGKKYQPVYEIDTVNNLLLETIIKQYRNNPYSYSFDDQKNVIQFKMCF